MTFSTISRGSRLSVWIGVTILFALVVAGLAISSRLNAQVAPSVAAMCSSLGTRLSGIPVPNGDVCDVVLVRHSPVITGHDGRMLNKFTLMNSVIEFENPTATGTAFVMGDFALLESELNTVLGLLSDFGWTVTGVHNHMIRETPKLTFVHWEAHASVDSIVSRVNQVAAQTSIRSGTPTTTPPAATSTPPTATSTPQSGAITLSVIKHLCASSVQRMSDVTNQNRYDVCPVVILPGNTTQSGVFGGQVSDFTLIARSRSTSTGSVITLGPPTLMRDRLCTTATTSTTTSACHDTSQHVWTVPRTDVTLTELAAAGSRYGFAELDPSDSGALISEGSGIVNLNTRNDADGRILIHLYNFRQ